MTTSSNSLPPAITTAAVLELAGFHVRLAQLRIFNAFAQAVGDPTLTPLLLGTLLVIAENPSINQSDLAAVMVADPSTMVRLIDQLEKRGWVVRETAAHDRRQTVPRATEEGRATVERLLPAIRASEVEALAPLDAAERADLMRLLRRLTAR